MRRLIFSEETTLSIFLNLSIDTILLLKKFKTDHK